MAVVAGMKNPNDHAEPTKRSNEKIKYKKTTTSQLTNLLYNRAVV